MTVKEREELVDAINDHIIERKDRDGRTVVDKNTLIAIIMEYNFKSDEDTKADDRSCQPNWEARCKELEEELRKMRMLLDSACRERDILQASLRTFEFIYGRKLNGIC